MTNQLLNDRYQIIQTLGSGGFGETFLAEDTQMPSRRRCVVKKLKPTQNNPALTQLIQERFQREAAILETLSSGSRQIPQLYAYFYSDQDQQFYLVQEWIEGQTLTALQLASGPLAETAVRQILTDILPVFSYIHSRSIVHRDIKPDNIILRHSDKLPVLIDFGAVREAMGTVMNSQGQPTQSIVIGTPGYMPSEQSIGRPVYNSDLYSLGLTAIYLLTSQQPTALPTDPNNAEILWRSQAPQVSSAFAQILDKAISYHHRDRYQNANEFLAALTGITITPHPRENQPTANPSNAATYAVSPGNAAQPAVTPAHTTSNKTKLVVGGAIAATIVGGAMATALFMNNSNSKNSNVANNPNPVSTATVSATPTPVETVPSAPAKNSSPPPVAGSPIASKSPASASPTNTPNPSAPNVVDPAIAVSAYYTSLNNRDYQTAWNKLPQELRDDRAVHSAGYSSFESWWNSINFIEVRNVRVVNQTANSAEAIASTLYYMKNGNVRPFRIRYWMVWNATTQTWDIAKVRAK